ncbi:LCP family protein [Christensenellaceae bacterium OttesenSCG-928-M15]|nr:LCP family protein [Christensenellaceae bacterium OttesenSCG-928-M15]
MENQDQKQPQAERNEKKPASKTRRIIQIAFIAVLAAALIFLGRLAYVAFVDPLSAFESTPRPIDAAQTPDALNTPSLSQVAQEPELTPTPEPTLSPEELLQQQADLEFMKNKVNILMLGWDQSPEREEENSSLYRDEDNNFRSDVIILLTVDFEQKTADLISVPRDTYAKIYNTKGHWKINAAFAKGGSASGEGFTYAMNTVSDLLGVPINYYAGVDMEGLKAVVDQMGGVYYDVDVEIRLNGRVLEKGYQHLNGQQVLDYCRARKGISTDVGRADRQQRILFAIFEQLKDNGRLVDIPNIYSAVADKIQTNLNLEQIAALSVFAMSLDMDHLNRHTLKGEYVDNVYNASFYVLHNSKLKELVKEIFGIDISPDSKYDASYVKKQKRSTAADAYISGAEYLLSVFSGSGSSRVRTELDNLRSAASVAASSGEEADNAAIASARSALRSAMYSMCVSNGITKQQVDRSRVPSDFYSILPDGAASSASSTPTPPPSSVDIPEIPDDTGADNQQGPIIDDEPLDQVPVG